MITVREASRRHHNRRHKQEGWITFYPQDDVDSLIGFGALESLDENRLPPGACLRRRPQHDVEIVTYVREGGLTYEDAVGGSGIIVAGEFQRMVAEGGVRQSESNTSRTNWAHVFQIWLRPSGAGLAIGHEQKRFTTAERRGGLCLVASPDARGGSLQIQQEALIFSALLDVGQHVVHELSPGRCAYFQLLQGEVSLGDVVLARGDGAAIAAERAVSLTANEDSEILLLDAGEQRATPTQDGDTA